MNLRNKKEIVKRLLKPGNGLSERTIKGGLWVFSLRIVNRLFQLTRTIVLARLLSPNDFGLFGIALLALSALNTFSQTGFRQALIQKKEDTKPYLNTAWTAGIIRGFLIAAILFICAPYVAIFFKSPSAEPILKIIGLAIILQSLTNIAVIYFEKELEFHKYFIYQFAGTILDVTVAISAAFLLRSVWALVFGLLAGNFARCIISYLIDPYRPKFYLDFPKAKELFEFGKWILGLSTLSFLISQGDDIFVGKLLGTIMLGYYQLAYRLSNMPATEITHVISQVTFPVYSKLQDDLSKLRDTYLNVLRFTSFLSFPIAGLIFALAPDFTEIFLGEKWMPMVPAMQIMALLGLIRSIGATTGPVFNAVGRPDIGTKIIMAKLIIFAAIIYPFTATWGIVGAAWATVLNALIMNPVADYQVIRIIRCSIWIFFKSLIIPFINTILIVAILFSLKKFLIPSTTSFNFLVLILVGFSVYLLATFIFNKALGYELIPTLKQRFIPSLREEE